MNIAPLEWLPTLGADGSTLQASGVSAPATDFGAWLEKNVGDTNDKLVRADHMVQKLALGEADNLHQVMIALDEAKLSFQLLVQVRNKLLDAYQDVLKMQI